MMEEVFLTLSAVFTYLKAPPESRCIVEGERILNAKHIISLGISERSGSWLKVFSLCLQTSALTSTPHEVTGQFLYSDEGNVHIGQFSCTCKAGLSGSCKHVAAVLLKCTRLNLLDLEQISCTDVKCYWSVKKKKIQGYEAKPILETECFKYQTQESPKLTEEQKDTCFAKITSVSRNSALFRYLNRQSTASHEVVSPNVVANIEIILKNAEASEFLHSLEIDIKNYSLESCCQETYKTVLNCTNIEALAYTTQGSQLWHQERQFRVTGSRCYSVFTYSKEEWTKKSFEYFWPPTFTNKYIEHGQKFEKRALENYSTSNNYFVAECGLIICRKYPWLAYSPDGVVINQGSVERLVEIKCPYEGIEYDAEHFKGTCSFLQISPGGEVSLKKRHKYYGQVQLGMAILNIKVTDLVLYSSKSDSFISIAVNFDKSFAKTLIEGVSYNFFKCMIHSICKKK